MSSRRIPPKEDQSLDEIDGLIRCALLGEVAGEEPSPQVWQNIQARLMTRSWAIPGQSGVMRPWRQLTSALQDWASGLAAPLDTNWYIKLTPRERAYLIWRENLLLSIMPVAAAINC
jgi:hypothetical protein